MNRTKLNIIKKLLGTDKWYLKEDKEYFPNFVFVFGGNGRVIMEYNKKYESLYYSGRFAHKFQIITDNRQTIKFLLRKHFKWEVSGIRLLPINSSMVVRRHFNLKKQK